MALDTLLDPAMSRRILDTIAVLLVVAPIANLYFLWGSITRLRRDPGRSPLLLVLIVINLVVWVIGVGTGILSWIYLARPPVDPTTPTGVFFGVGLLLLQTLPHYINSQILKLERGPTRRP